MYDRIVLPLDGSPFANQAVIHATTLAQRLGVPIHIIRSVDDLATSVQPVPGAMDFGVNYAAMQQILDAEEQDAQAFIETEVRNLEASGQTVTGAVVKGAAARAIVDATREGDLIVMASHGRSGVKRLVLGSVAEDVVRHASVPVLLVHASEEPAS